MKKIICTVALSFMMASAAWALSTEEKFIVGLQAQGFTIVKQERTIFGRVRIVAENERLRREIVVNRNTGEILRDYSVLLADLLDTEREEEVVEDSTAHSSKADERFNGAQTSSSDAAVMLGATAETDVYILEERRGADGDVQEVIIYIPSADITDDTENPAGNND